jgi:hypothetical protein
MEGNVKKIKQGRKILFMMQITFRHKFLRVLGLGRKLSSIFGTNEEPAQFKWHLSWFRSSTENILLRCNRDTCGPLDQMH